MGNTCEMCRHGHDSERHTGDNDDARARKALQRHANRPSLAKPFELVISRVQAEALPVVRVVSFNGSCRPHVHVKHTRAVALARNEKPCRDPT